MGRNCSVSKVQLTVWGNRGNYNCTRYLVCDVRLSGMRSFFVVHSVYVIVNQYVFHHLVCLGNTLTRTCHGYSSKVLIHHPILEHVLDDSRPRIENENNPRLRVTRSSFQN